MIARLLFAATFLLVALLNLQFLKLQPWFGDFWHHSAIINFLISDLWPASDPFLPGYPRQIPYWPYEALVALFARFLARNAIHALAFFSFINLALFFYALKRLVESFQLPSYGALLFLFVMLGCWGDNPPNFSAFFHAQSFFFILSYPSTFACALALIGISRFVERTQGKERALALDIGIATLIVLAHPITFLFYAAMVVGSYLMAAHLERTRIINMALLLITPMVAWAFWPLFPLELFLKESHFSGDPAAQKLYSHMFTMGGLAWVGVVFLFIQWRERKDRSLALPFVLLLIPLGYGFIQTKWNYGRVISYIFIILQFALVREFFVEPLRKAKRIALMLLFAFSFLNASLVISATLSFVNQQYQEQNQLNHRLIDLNPKFSGVQSILASAEISKILPSFGARVLVFDVAPFFRDKFQSLREAQERFFTPGAPIAERCKIILDHKIDRIFLDLNDSEQSRIDADIRPFYLHEPQILKNRFTIADLNLDQCRNATKQGYAPF